MVSLEQIRALEARVEKAVGLIDKLRKENAELEQRLADVTRSEEQARAAYVELERNTSDSGRFAAETEARIGELGERLAAAEERSRAAESRAAAAVAEAAATASEKVLVLERRTQAAETESALYKERALAAERKAADLEARAENFKKEQSRIEEGLASALQKLDAFEDLVMGISADSAGEPVETPEGPDAPKAPSMPQEAPFPGVSPQEIPAQGDEHELDIF